MRGRTIGIVVLIMVVVIIGFFGLVFLGPMVYFARVAPKKQRMQTAEFYLPMAEKLALLCQSIPEEMTLTSSDTAWLPKELRELEPHWGTVEPERAFIQMGGGFDHYGYSLVLDEKLSDDRKTKWNLEYHGESHRKQLCTVTLDRKDTIGQEQFITNTLEGYAQQIKMNPGDVELHKYRLLFLLRFKRLQEARDTCQESVQLLPSHWLPRLTLAFLDSRLGKADQASREFSAWVSGNPSFTHYFYLFHFYRKEGLVDLACRALRSALSQPLQTSSGDHHNEHFFGYDAAAFAFRHAKYSLVIDLCTALENGGYQSSRGFFRLRFLMLHSAALHLSGEREKAYALVKEFDSAQTSVRNEDVPTGILAEMKRAVLHDDTIAISKCHSEYIRKLAEQDGHEFYPYRETTGNSRMGEEAVILYPANPNK